MASAIRSDQLQGLKIFDSVSEPLQLCCPHQKQLCDAIATNINKLVQSPFFQDKFRALFPSDHTGTHFNIRLTDHSLIVRLMREDVLDHRLPPESEALTIDLHTPENEEIIEINKTIIKQADAIYQQCQNEHFQPHRTTSSHSLRDHDTRDLRHVSEDEIRDELDARPRYRRPDLRRVSENDLLDELDARCHYGHPAARHDLDSISPRAASCAPNHTESRTRRTVTENPADSLRRVRELHLDLQLEAERLSDRPNATIDQLARLHEHICRLEQQIQRLSEQLETPLMTAAVSTPAPILEKIHERLSQIDEHLRQLEGPSIVQAATTPSSDRVDVLEQQCSQLEAHLADATSQIDSLKECNLELFPQPPSLIGPSPNRPCLTNEQFELLTSLAQKLGDPSVRDSKDFPFATDTQFLNLPQEVRDSIYFQMYSICNPISAPGIWRSGENFFLNQAGLHGTNGLRALAITRYQLHWLANEYAMRGNEQTASPELSVRFSQLPEEDQIGILRQHQFLHRQSHEPMHVARNSFLGLNDSIITNEERNEAISRYLQVQMSEDYGRTISKLTDELISLSEKLNATHQAHAVALEQLDAEMTELRDQNRLALANAMFHVSDLESDLDSTRNQIAQFNADVSSRDLQIAALQQQVDEAAKQQRLAQEQINQLTHSARDKDLEIAQFHVQLQQAEEQKRLALAEIDRLTLEGNTRDSHISDLEREGGTKDVHIGELKEHIRKLEDELNLAQINWTEQERLHGVAINEKDAKIDEITPKYELLISEKKELQNKLNQSYIESDHNEYTLNAQIVELQTRIQYLSNNLKEKELGLEETQEKLEAKTKHFNEIKQRWINTKRELNTAKELQAKLEKSSVQHNKAEQVWKKKRASLERTIEDVKEEQKRTEAKNAELHEQLDSALKKLHAQVKNNQALTLDSKTQADTLQWTTSILNNEIECQAGKILRLEQTQSEMSHLLKESEEKQKDLFQALNGATEERNALQLAYAELEQMLQRQREEFNVENTELRQNIESAFLQRFDAQVKELTLASEKQADELQSTIVSLSDQLELESKKARNLEATKREISHLLTKLEEKQQSLLSQLEAAIKKRDDLEVAYAELERMLQRQRERV